MKQLLAVLLLGLAVSAQAAASYSIDWFTVDGGGGTSTGGSYSLSGTIGQPDACRLSGGSYVVNGGGLGGGRAVPGASSVGALLCHPDSFPFWTAAGSRRL